jgi:hypothetical protein
LSVTTGPNWRPESVGEFGFVGDHEQAVGGGVDQFLAGVGRPAALDQVAVCHLVGPVDGHVGRRVVERGEGDPFLAGEFPRLVGGGDAPDIQPGIDRPAQRPDGVGRGAAGAQSHDLSVVDGVGGGLAGASLRLVAPAAFHARGNRARGQKAVGSAGSGAGYFWGRDASPRVCSEPAASGDRWARR